MAERKSNVRIITLGCAKNEVDSEEIAGVLQNAGHTVDGSAPAEITVINTCGFLESAKHESIAAIRKAVAEKGAGKVIVAGCLAQRMGEDLARLAPGADAYVGVGHMADFGQIVDRVFGRADPLMELGPPHHRWADTETRARPGKPWSAYLKVSEGCDHRCTFCTIPSFRGAHRSKPLDRVLQEARHLVRTGAREINLIAQDVTQYGYDIEKRFLLPTLLSELNQLDELEWIRVLYFYPNRLTDEVIEALATLPKVAKYIDIPLQHVHPATLRRMKRPWDGDRYLELFRKVRQDVPNIAIRTTFIVGFPGETEEEFNCLVNFVKEAKLDRVGAFTFSREPGTPSYDMPGQVSSRIKRDRYDRLMRAQAPVSLARNQALIGQTIKVLVEESKDGWIAGRSERDAPEIDGMVYAPGAASPGEFVSVAVTEARMHDVIGRLAGSDPAPGRRASMVPLRMASRPL